MRHLSSCFSMLKQYKPTIHSVPFVNVPVVFDSLRWMKWPYSQTLGYKTNSHKCGHFYFMGTAELGLDCGLTMLFGLFRSANVGRCTINLLPQQESSSIPAVWDQPPRRLTTEMCNRGSWNEVSGWSLCFPSCVKLPLVPHCPGVPRGGEAPLSGEETDWWHIFYLWPRELKWEVIKLYLDLQEQATHWNTSVFSKILIKKLDFTSSSKQAKTPNKTLPLSSHSSIGTILHKLKLMHFFN